VEVSVAGGAGLPVAEARKETLLAQAPTDVPQGTYLDNLTNLNTDFAGQAMRSARGAAGNRSSPPKNGGEH
jgi:hypothetical protein